MRRAQKWADWGPTITRPRRSLVQSGLKPSHSAYCSRCPHICRFGATPLLRCRKFRGWHFSRAKEDRPLPGTRPRGEQYSLRKVKPDVEDHVQASKPRFAPQLRAAGPGGLAGNGPELAPDQSRCLNRGKEFSLDAQISGCTAVLQSDSTSALQ